jgi:hypothetical protein
MVTKENQRFLLVYKVMNDIVVEIVLIQPWPTLDELYRMIKKFLDQGCRGINKLYMKLFISIIFDIYLTTFKLAGYNSK